MPTHFGQKLMLGGNAIVLVSSPIATADLPPRIRTFPRWPLFVALAWLVQHFVYLAVVG